MSAVIALSLFGLFGLGLFGTGATMLQRRLRARLGREVIVGEIVRWEAIRGRAHRRHGPSVSGPGSKTRFVPHVRYTDAQGRSHTARVAQQYGRIARKARPVGARYGLFPKLDDPVVAYPESWIDNFVLPLLLVAAGGLVVLLALGMTYGAAVDPG